jgi:hypothetical protein
MDVLRVGHEPHADILALTRRYGLVLRHIAAGQSLPGSYWGESEAGLRGNELFTRPDTPLHSLLHELSHYVCMTAERRRGLDRDAGGDDAEECAVCYLQILLAGELPVLGRDRMFLDMDAWGYSFRLGSARAWFELDAADARAWLRAGGLIDDAGRPTFALRAPACGDGPGDGGGV